MPSTAEHSSAGPRIPDPSAKWQACWEQMGLFRAPDMPRPGRKYFVMPMFAYPSGDIHMGHFRNYTLTDAIARKKLMEGYDVLHAFGWDAFGLPAEQAAITRGQHPEDWTLGNITQSQATLRSVGISFDWTREVTSCLPDYYRWTQWMFLQLHRHDLAYRKEGEVNWCATCNTVLANEQAAGGTCWRCGNTVTRKTLTQWYFRITAYAERLLADIDRLDGWPENVRAMQRNWIGRSVGAEIDFRLDNGALFPVFTTRPDTIYGVTFMAIAPDAPLLKKLAIPAGRRGDVDKFVAQALARRRAGREVEEEKSGVPTGISVTNPVSGEPVPLWVADYVLAGYGTGCIMGVPAHDQRDFEFARKYGLPIRPVIRVTDNDPPSDQMTAALPDEGTMINSGPFNGKAGRDGFNAVVAYVETQGIGRRQTQYHLADWLISRQRYWGTPIPMIHCPDCGIVPVPEADLPVLLPKGKIDYLPKGRSPLADVPEFMNVRCPACDGPAQRDPDTMDTFVCSSWYFLRYVDAHNDRAPFDRDKAKAWLPVDYYMGGIEHATGHLVYFRFFTKFLNDIGWLTVDEPALTLFNHGMVMDAVGQVMSKSKGNVISPVEVISRHGVDPARLTMFFSSPADREVLWSEAGMVGIERFLLKVDRFVRDAQAAVQGRRFDPDGRLDPSTLPPTAREVYRKLHETIRKIDRDFAAMQLNTCTAAVMELIGVAAPGDQLPPELRAVCAATMARLLAPLTPHLAEEWWEILGFGPTIFRAPWPTVDAAALPADEMTIAVQINGRLRGQVTVPADAREEHVVRAAEGDAKIASHLHGTRIRQVYVPGRLINFVVRPG